MKNIVVTGGAGYLGRCTMDVLLTQGYQPLCLDNYSRSRRFESADIPQFDVDVADSDALSHTWKRLPPVDGILHFAAFALVGESMANPALYFRNNLLATLALAERAAADGIPLVHSSSCAVYGVPSRVPIDETAALAPISPYGETKRAGEEILGHFSRTQKLNALNLRYFNPSGALSGASHGESHEPETHLIPNVLRAGLTGMPVSILGSKHATTDGTCVRDYLHVEDLVKGHIQALEYVQSQSPGAFDAINLGSGRGHSVLEVIAAAERALGGPVPVTHAAARPGDPPELVASIDKARRVLGWKPERDLDEILRSALEWEKRRVYAMKTA